MADGIFAIILLYSFIAGARRGFYKEVVQTLALVGAIYITQNFYEQAGHKLADSTGMPEMVGHAVGGFVLWVVAFFVLAVVGRLVLKKLRGKSIDDQIGAGAEAVADALGGDTTKGPVTLLTDPIATKTGIFYWSDKILGAALGLLKGIATGYILFGICVYADRARNWNSYFVKSIEASYATKLYEEAVQPYLATFPAYKIVTSLGQMNKIAELVHEEPWRFGELANHPELAPLSKNEQVRALREDKEIMAQWKAGDLKGLLLNEKVRGLLRDKQLRQTVADVNWKKVHDDVKAAKKSESLKKLIPDGAGNLLPVPTGTAPSPPSPPPEVPPPADDAGDTEGTTDLLGG